MSQNKHKSKHRSVEGKRFVETLESRLLFTTYNAAADFSTAANPNGVWSYGELVGGSAGFTAYPTAGPTDIGPTGWTTGSQSPPYVTENTSGATIHPLTLALPSGVLDMHPGPNGEYSIVRFTAPTTGPLEISFTFKGVDVQGTTTDVHLWRNYVDLAAGSINTYGGTFSDTVDVPDAQAGENFDFAVGWGANQDYRYDSTSLSATIVQGGGLKILGIPANTDVNKKLQPLRVEVLDAKGRLDTSATTPIAVSIDPTSSGTGMLSGTSPIDAINGIATFSDLTINKPGIYALDFSDSGDSVVSTKKFQIYGDKLVVRGHISNGVPGQAIPSFEVDLVNKTGAINTTGSSLVTLGITPVNAGTGGTITGNTATLANGRAIFSGLTFSQPGKYLITATDAANDGDSPTQEITVTGLHLFIKLQPSKEVSVGARLNYTIEALDYRNRLVNTSMIGLGLQLNTISGGVNAALSNPSDLFNFGIANNTSSDVDSINAVGEYTITFTVISEHIDGYDYTIDPVTSSPFKVVANHLTFVQQPQATSTGLALRYKIEMRDYHNNVVSTNFDKLQFSLLPIGSGATLSGGVDTLVSGDAIDANNMLFVDTPGTYSLYVTDVPAAPGDPVASAVQSSPFKVKAIK